MKVIEKTLFTDQSLGATFNSSIIDCFNIKALGIQINATVSGANTGQFSIQVSNDSDASAATWDTLTTSPSIAALADASALFTISLANLSFRYLRVRFVIGTGTDGTATCKVFGKEV